ncbi:MAG: GNAT family N-acetyltransferase [Proteobacteria bacterium]|uniref:bifunctional helix-turn-helix transcriptional regulator/GNAT family N-acetyltransferase n=1 Tax=Rudaea sp. TaxID=2136325 RepID=UPI003220008D|nr:GNAT family N-acetyltransferase [Pseudomonadota bacterium]
MFLQSQAELALGSRFKALSEHCYRIANAAYRATGIELDAHWFPVLRYVQVKGPGTVTQIAQAIGQTHSAVSQLATRLVREGWLVRKSDRADARRSVLDLSAAGERRLAQMGPVWTAIRRATAALLARHAGDLGRALAALEAELAGEQVLREILAQHARLAVAKVEIAPFKPALREHFYRINAQWLERYWSLEPIDRDVLSEPEKHVLKPGGAIFYALADGEVIGTVALIKDAAAGEYEVSKMGVEAGWRGKGAGRLLLDAVVAEFRRRKGRLLFLESNSKLGPALNLYASAGFVHQPALRPGSHYARSDVYMIYAGKPVAKAAKTVKRSRGR